LKEYLNSRLKKTFNTRHTYLFSPPLETNDHYYEYYVELEKENGFCILPCAPKPVSDKCYFIIFKVDFKDEIIDREPRAIDLTEEPLIYRHNQRFYISNQDSLLPFIVILVEPFIEKSRY